MNEIRFNVTGYDVTEKNEVKNQITNFVINEVETNKKNCRFSCVLSLDDDDWKVISYITKNKGEKNYSLVFSLRKSGTFVWEQMGHDFNFGTLAGTNVNMLIGTVMGKFDEIVGMMIAEGGKMSVDEQMFNEVKETIEEMVENETPFNTHIWQSLGVFEYLFPNELNIEGRFETRLKHKIEKYYKECMKAKLCRLYNADGKMNDFEIDRLYYKYMSMLGEKWDFILEFGEVNTEVKMVNEEIENAVKNDAPCLDSVEEIVDEYKELYTYKRMCTEGKKDENGNTIYYEVTIDEEIRNKAIEMIRDYYDNGVDNISHRFSGGKRVFEHGLETLFLNVVMSLEIEKREKEKIEKIVEDRNIYNIVNTLCLKADADDYFEVSIYDVADYVNADDEQKKVLEKLNRISGGDYITLELDIENFAITVNSTEDNLNIYTDGYNYLQDNVTWDELIDRINKFLDGKIEKRLNEFVKDIKENGYTPCSTEEYWSNGYILMYCVEEELFEDKFDFTETTPFEIGMDLYNDKRVIAYAVFDRTDIEDVVTNCLYDEEEKEIGCGYYLSIECPDDFVNGMVVIKNNEDYTTHTFNLMDYYEHIVDVYRGNNCNIVERIAEDVTDAINKMVA